MSGPGREPTLASRRLGRGMDAPLELAASAKFEYHSQVLQGESMGDNQVSTTQSNFAFLGQHEAVLLRLAMTAE